VELYIGLAESLESMERMDGKGLAAGTLEQPGTTLEQDVRKLLSSRESVFQHLWFLQKKKL
jgi:hypothetical protein